MKNINKDTERKMMDQYRDYLCQEEKSQATVEKYMRDVRLFFDFLEKTQGGVLVKESVLAYKAYLVQKYAPVSVNSMLVALNGFLKYVDREDCCVKTLKIQKQLFCSEERELTKGEYQRLVCAAKDTRLFYILQTICSTGIRISELSFITVEAVREGKTEISCKNKRRTVFLSKELQKLLKQYIFREKRKSGPVFVSKHGKPLNRSNIWRDMKGLCDKAKVCREKVFPHNLRHLFARLFYTLEKDIVKLADILGHSSVNTTRIYTMETGYHHRKKLEKIQRLLIT